MRLCHCAWASNQHEVSGGITGTPRLEPRLPLNLIVAKCHLLVLVRPRPGALDGGGGQLCSKEALASDKQWWPSRQEPQWLQCHVQELIPLASQTGSCAQPWLGEGLPPGGWRHLLLLELTLLVCGGDSSIWGPFKNPLQCSETCPVICCDSLFCF